MKIAISNIAWLPEEDRDALAMLRECGLSAVEAAPSRWWPDPAKATAEEARERRERLHTDGLSVAGFQAILFGKPDLTLFDSADQRRACLNYLTHIAQLLAICGGGPIVFGAPKNRLVPAAMSRAEADRIAVEFFVELAGRAARLGVWYCLEPNPTGYGCNYVTHVADAARIVRQVNSPGLRMQIDAGELAMNDEAVARIVGEHHDIIGHVHVSQPMLGSFEAPWAGHSALASALTSAGYTGFASVEMKRPTDGLKGVRGAVKFARQCYGTT
jgi:D-psicose/D-tagatose/L-ribulose 3-epimerase